MKILLKLLGVGASVAAVAAARKTLEAGWRNGAGHESPKKADDLENSLPGCWCSPSPRP